MTTTVARVELTPRERQVIEGLANGNTLATVALDLKIREGTALGYLKLAKGRLCDVGETPAAVAIGYATEAITRPQLLDPEGLFLPREQRDLVPLIAQGMACAQMATMLFRSVGTVRRESRELLVNLQVRNRAHAMKRAWQYQLLAEEQVIPWLR